MSVQLKHDNFKMAKAAFKDDTDLDADDVSNRELYMQYYHAKMADFQMQVMIDLVDEVRRLRDEVNAIRQSVGGISSKMNK